MRKKEYESAAERQKAYRERMKGGVETPKYEMPVSTEKKLVKVELNQVWDSEKYPNKRAWEIAVERANRAIRYALKFPKFIKPSEVKFQMVEWQYENEGLPLALAAEKRAAHLGQ